MHTAFTLKSEMFDVEINGRPADRSAFFAAKRHERIGVVVTSPLGGLGASFMVQLGITAYYDADRSGRMVNPHYPEVYFFHAGGSFGEYSVLDAHPARKQVYLNFDGDEILASVNSHAITHLLLPEDMKLDSALGFAEPNAATDRLEHCFLYAPSGRVHDGDVAIRSQDPVPLEDIAAVMNLREALPEMVAGYPVPDNPAERVDNEKWIAAVSMRLDDIEPPAQSRALQYRKDLTDCFGGFETYQKITSSDAVAKLGVVMTS